MSCQPLGRWIRGGCGLLGIVTSENQFCKNPTSKDTITAIYSESYGSIGGHKHSPDQGTGINPDTEVQMLQQSLQTGIEPRIQGIRMRAIPVDGDRFVILIRITHSRT